MRTKQHHGGNRRRVLFVIIFLVSAVLNLLSWKSRLFSDFYVSRIFPYVTAPLSRLTAVLPFSIGECMLIAAVLWLLVLAGVLVFLAVDRIRHKRKKSHQKNEPAGRYCRSAWFLRATAWLANIVFLVMTLNCVILYHVTPLEESLPGYGKTYSVEELARLRDYVAEKCNVLALRMPRGEDGEVFYEGGDAAMAQEARRAIAREAEEVVRTAASDQAEGVEDSVKTTASGNVKRRRNSEASELPEKLIFERLRGWSTTPKGMFASEFISQQYMQGYYFPFSMEANYNTVMKVMNKPFTMCHELVHTHGYIYEDEANLLGFLACIHSKDEVFQYSGWLGVLNYVDNAFYRNVDRQTYRAHPVVSETVRSDNEFLSKTAWEKVEKNAVLSTETVKAAADTYLDTTLKANGVSGGKASYEHVVGLLLEYFDGNFPE